MKKQFIPTLILSLFATLAHAEQSTPLPLNYNFADQETKAINSIKSADAEIVKVDYKDLDEDGVNDQLDHCPNSILHVEVDARGCELDSDLDKVVNRLDQCPDTAPGVPVNRFGCEGDEDNDGVVDSKDLCPGTPEGEPVNEHGCESKPIVLTNIVFDHYEHAIREDQMDTLKKDAAALNDLKEGEVVLVTGHTDSSGSEALNQRLSWRRANSTKDFLLQEMDFDPKRILIDGKGELEPIADNQTAEGKQQNRRIELKVLSRGELPDSAKVIIPEEMLKR